MEHSTTVGSSLGSIRRYDTQHNDTQHKDTQHMGLICDFQHNNTAIKPSVIVLSVAFYLLLC
jgi:hypothetical protein